MLDLQLTDLMSEGGGVGLEGDLVRQDVQVELLAAADPVVRPTLLLVLCRPDSLQHLRGEIEKNFYFSLVN